MNMKDMIQRMTDLENEAKQQLTESQQLEECPPDMAEGGEMPPAPMNPGNPVTMNVNLNASGAEHVEDLLRMMQQAGLSSAKPVDDKMMSPRLDMERLRSIVDEPEMEDEEIEEYDNEPDYEYSDHEKMTHDLSGGINREKKQFKAAQRGDNAMAVEDIAKQLYAKLAEKKAKPDYIDIDGDGDKEEPMKKAVKDKEAKKDKK